MQAKAVIFDYHGTLVDPWKRYLESFSQAMKKCCNSAVTDREFIKEQRRAGTPTHKILESILKKSGFPQSSELIEEINNYRRTLVSSPDFFRENPDTLIESAKETLQKMKKQGAKLFLVSLIPLLDHSEERKIKKRGLIVDSPKARDFLKSYTGNVTLTKLVKSSESVQFQTVMQLYDNKVSYITLTEKYLVGIIITDEYIAKTHKYLFDSLWELTSGEIL